MNTYKELAIDTLALTRGHGLILDLSGTYNKRIRQELMQRLTGQKLPLAKCGVTALNSEYLRVFHIPRGTIRDEENRLSEA